VKSVSLILSTIVEPCDLYFSSVRSSAAIYSSHRIVGQLLNMTAQRFFSTFRAHLRQLAHLTKPTHYLPPPERMPPLPVAPTKSPAQLLRLLIRNGTAFISLHQETLPALSSPPLMVVRLPFPLTHGPPPLVVSRISNV
jgi:hypothetical protein